MADTDTDTDTSKPWSHRRQEIGVIVWASFLIACLATMLFFAVVDPLRLAEALSYEGEVPAWLTNSMTGYALGFFFFWLMTLLTALLTAYLIDTLPPEQRKSNSGTGSSTTTAARAP